MTMPVPHSIEAEQNLLGALLTDNRLFGRIGGFLQREHFYDPLHGLIYQTAHDQVAAGRKATPISIEPALGGECAPGVSARQYLTKLASEAASLLDAPDHAEMIRDMCVMRRIAGVAGRVTGPDPGYPRDKLSAAFDELDLIRGELVGSNSRRMPVGDISAEILDRVGRVRGGEKVDVYTPTGYPDIDRIMNGGWYGGDLIVLAGRPGMGKTAMACCLAVEAARRGAGAVVFSLEIDRRQTASRMLAHRSYASHTALSFGRINAAKEITDDELWRLEDATKALAKLNILVDDTPRLTVGQIAQRAKAEKEKLAKAGVSLGLVVVDYLKFVKASDRYKGQRVYEVGEISAGLKEMAKDLNTTVILCAQLNRGVESREDKRPDLADLRESGDLEADADAVMFLYREHYYLTRSSEYRAGSIAVQEQAINCEHGLELIVSKNRKGATGTVNLFCDIASSHISQAY